MSSQGVQNLAKGQPADQPSGVVSGSSLRDYWMGIKDPSRLSSEGLPECPFSVLHVGGMDFPLVTEIVKRKSGETVTQRTQIFGIIRKLFPEDVARLKSKMKNKVIRGRRLLSIDSPHYRKQVGDIPIEKFLYIREIQPQDIQVHRPLPPVSAEAIRSEELAQENDELDKTRRQVHGQLKATGQKLP